MTIKQSILQQFHHALKEQNTGKPSIAIKHYKKAIQTARDSNPNLLAVLFLNLGQLQEKTGKIQDAVITYETGYKVWAQEEGFELPKIKRDLSAVSKTHSEASNTNRGVLPDLFTMSKVNDLTISKEQHLSELTTLMEDHLLGVKLRFGIGNSYLRMHQDAPAKHAFEQALKMPEVQTSALLEAKILTHIAIILRREGELEKAKDNFSKALVLFETSPLEKRRVLSGLAGIDVAKKDINSAYKKYEEALKLYGQVDDPVGEGRCCANLGLLLLTQEKYIEAEAMLKHARSLTKDTKDNDTRWWVYWGLGRNYNKRNKGKKAAKAFKKSLELIERRQWQLRTDEGKVSFLENVQVVFDELITLYFELGKFQQALEIAESSRAQSLNVIMNSKRRRSRSLKLPKLSNSPSEDEQWEALRSLIPSLPEKPISDKLQRLLDPKTSIKEGKNILLEMAPTIQTHTDFLPEVWVLLNDFRQVNFRKLQELEGTTTSNVIQDSESAPSNQIIQAAPSNPINFQTEESASSVSIPSLSLERFKTPSKPIPALNRLVFHVLADKTIIFVEQDTDKTFAHALELTQSELSSEVRKLRQLMQVDEARETKQIDGGKAIKSTAIDPAEQLQHLYQLLIAPLESHLPKHDEVLVIEPHDALWLLPFAALKTPSGNYIADQWQLQYTPSHGVLQEIRREYNYGQAKDQKALIIGNPTMPDVISFGDQQFSLKQLEGAEEEAEAIHKLFTEVTESQLLTADNATKTNVLSSIPEVGVLHFATHGLADSDNPMDSFMVLAGEDAQLTARDIINLHCRMELVVLSACQTGLGQISGEGMIGLCRAFLVAGARGVLVSQWSVSDPATRDLMISFYEQYLSHGDKAKALQMAMKDLRQNPAYVHPRYWGAFVLFGM